MVNCDWRDVRVAYGADLESPCRLYLPRVQIPLSPNLGVFYLNKIVKESKIL